MPGTTHVGSRLILVSSTSGEGNFFTLKFESQQSFRLEAFPPRQVKAHTFVQKGYFCFFHYFLFASLINNWAQTFAGWLFLLHLVGIHQGRITGLWLIPKIYTLPLKAVDTNGNCQNPVFSLCVSQHVHEITNLWKFELDWLSELRDNYERKKHHCHTKLCTFRCLISRPQVVKLLLSRKLHHFRGSRFSQDFILSTSPHY